MPLASILVGINSHSSVGYVDRWAQRQAFASSKVGDDANTLKLHSHHSTGLGADEIVREAPATRGKLVLVWCLRSLVNGQPRIWGKQQDFLPDYRVNRHVCTPSRGNRFAPPNILLVVIVRIIVDHIEEPELVDAFANAHNP